jgi:hypothetical protein
LDVAEYASMLTGDAYKELFGRFETQAQHHFAPSSAFSLNDGWGEEFVDPGAGFLEPIPIVPEEKEEQEPDSRESSTDHDCGCQHCLCIDCKCGKSIKADSSSDRTRATEHHAPREPIEKPKVKRTELEWNNFQVRRACFRGMSTYFKSKFSKLSSSRGRGKQSNS